MEQEKQVTLDQARKGSEVEILSVPEGMGKAQLIRLGICEGVKLILHEKLPMGPVILRRKRQEIAIGQVLARGIHVRQSLVQKDGHPHPNSFHSAWKGFVGPWSRRLHPKSSGDWTNQADGEAR